MDQDINHIINSENAKDLLKDKDKLKDLLNSPDTQRLMQMLEESSGGGLKHAAQAAAKGKPEGLLGIIQGLMQSKEGSELMGRIQKSTQK